MANESILEKIESEKRIFVINNDDEVKRYIIKKFEEVKDLDLSDEVLDSSIVEDEKEMIVGVEVNDKIIVDTLTIALARVYQKIDGKLKEKFNYFLNNFEIELYKKSGFKNAPFFKVYVDGKMVISDRRIKIRFSQMGWVKKGNNGRERKEIGSKRFLQEIHVLEDRIMKYLKN
ncbi:hypothetical protein [Methanotorris igneus]|uniref:Uncharacterized protein n=1 Tax=Methanotorris igneus (strain DSM 5666 / JCM 11834 / Kol 5) TaxID=880724 RepID=F6BF63_METIK|nr:hypothetical protein [Methanotorris igneus]AEF96933.1 hypothetical protein Metig_1398 [Methanotorris igneus Kol 5]